MKYLLFFIGILLSSLSFGQKKAPKLEIFLSESINKNAKNAYEEIKENFVHFYAIAFCFDHDGKIDTLYYSSKLNPSIKSLYHLDNSLLQEIKAENFLYKEYASQTVLIPFFHNRSPDNFIDYKCGFLINLENLIPQAGANKAMIVRKPVIITYFPSIK